MCIVGFQIQLNSRLIHNPEAVLFLNDFETCNSEQALCNCNHLNTLFLHTCERRRGVFFVDSERGSKQEGREEKLLRQVADRQTER